MRKISCAILLTDLALGEPIGIATVLDTLMVGPLFDVFDALLHLKAPERLLPGILVMSLGMILLAVGQRIYMPAQFSCGPRAALTVGVGKRLRKLPIGAVEGIIQVSACLAGWLLGGTVGIGTVWFALFNGVAMQGVFRLTKFEPREMNHIGIHQLLKIKHNT